MTFFWAILLFAVTCISKAFADHDCGDGSYCESRFAQSVVCCDDNECCYSLAIWVYVLISVCSFSSVCCIFIICRVRRRNARAIAVTTAAPSQPSNIPMTNVNTGPPPQNNIPYAIPAS
uniref:Vesicular, overexpressed in cancer, prosurvival protein 1 n=1 Tax=Panagrolaimus davidi TaxID=227884 RepID=A0A914QE46_9BILA